MGDLYINGRWLYFFDCDARSAQKFYISRAPSGRAEE
jgi:hypothetical protein